MSRRIIRIGRHLAFSIWCLLFAMCDVILYGMLLLTATDLNGSLTETLMTVSLMVLLTAAVVYLSIHVLARIYRLMY